jgi:hypothetical protein
MGEACVQNASLNLKEREYLAHIDIDGIKVKVKPSL